MKFKLLSIALFFGAFTASAQSISNISRATMFHVSSAGNVTSSAKKPLAFLTDATLINKDSALLFELKPNGDIFNAKTKTIAGNINAEGKVIDSKGTVLGFISNVTGTILDAHHFTLGYYNAGVIRPNWCAVLFFFYQES